MQNKTVAVVSNNIPAVKNVIEKLGANSYENFYAYLASKDSQIDFFENYSREIKFDEDWELDSKLKEKQNNRLFSISKEIMKLLEFENRLYELKEELELYNCEFKYYKEYYKNNSFIDIKIGSFLKLDKEKVLNFVVDNYSRNSLKKRSVLDNVKLFFKYGFYKFKDLNENEGHYIASLFKRYYELKIGELEKEISQISKQLINKFFEKLKKEHIELSELCFKDALFRRFSGERDVFEYQSYKKNYEEFIKAFPLIFSTSYSITNSIPKGF